MSQAKLFVGIDVASRKFDVSFLGADKKPVRPIATYENDHAGWMALIDTLETLGAAHGPVLCGMESTGSWHKHLERMLGEHEGTSIEVCTLNPYGVKHFARALLMDSKTDKTDSKLIALYLVHMKPEPNYRPIPGNEELKEATRSRRRLIEDRSQAKNRLHKLMNSHYPGYRTLVGETFTVRLLTLLSDMQSPCAILAHTIEDLAQRSTGHRHRMGAEFAGKLHQLARLAPKQALSKTTELLIQMGAQRILQLSEHLRELDKCIDRMLSELYPDQHLTSIPGIGPVSAAAILAEVGDVTRFPDKTQFIGYCGLYPIVWESGNTKRRYQMTRKGNRMLKTTLLVVTASARQYNPVIAAFYERLRKRDKSTKAAGGALARKLAGLVFAILSKNEPWSADVAQRGLEKANAMLA